MKQNLTVAHKWGNNFHRQNQYFSTPGLSTRSTSNVDAQRKTTLGKVCVMLEDANWKIQWGNHTQNKHFWSK